MNRSIPPIRGGWGVALLAALLLPAASQLHAQATPLQGLDDFIEAGMAEWGIPGMAVAVVHRDQVIHSQGYGVLRLGEERAVDQHTLFGIASVSKAFTAAALGILVDEGRLDWDDPVTRHLPDFRLYDPYVTETVTVRDLLAHRVGVGRMTGNRIQWLPARERTELMARIRHLAPEQTFRNGYVYSNVMYMVAGEVVRAVSGQSWDDFVEERIFGPLGMDRSTTSVTAIAQGENAAWPHQEIRGEVVPIPRRNFDNVGASASINTSVDQLTAWMRLHLGEPGEVAGLRLLAPSTVREMHRAQNALGDAGLSGGLASYGLGWRISSYEGRRMSQHGGATDGMNTTLVLLPEEELGIVITTNTFNSFMNAVANRIMDRFLGIDDRPWDRNIRASYLASYDRAMAARDSVDAAREEGTNPSGPLSDFTGTFYDPLYADVEVTLEGDELSIAFWGGDNDQVLILEHWHHDTFRGHWRNPAQREEFVWFIRDDSGEVNQLHIRWTLRPLLLQAGTYPANYTRTVTFHRTQAP